MQADRARNPAHSKEAMEACHAAILRALDEAGIRNDVLRGMCIEVGLDAFNDSLAASSGGTEKVEKASLLSALEARFVEVGRKGGNTAGNSHREEWEFLRDLLMQQGVLL